MTADEFREARAVTGPYYVDEAHVHLRRIAVCGLMGDPAQARTRGLDMCLIYLAQRVDMAYVWP